MENRVGQYGFAGLIITVFLMTFTGGLSFLLFLFWTVIKANAYPVRAVGARDFWVPGKQLIDNLPDEEFIARLDRVLTLLQEHKRQGIDIRILLLGGETGESKVRESKAAYDYLVNRGVSPELISKERRSAHTLENIVFALKKHPDHSKVALVSNRYHLPRLRLMSQEQGLTCKAVAAEDKFLFSPPGMVRWLQEGFYSHWFVVTRTIRQLLR